MAPAPARSLADILVAARVVAGADHVARAAASAGDSAAGGAVVAALVAGGAVDETAVARALAAAHRVPFVDVTQARVDDDAARAVPLEWARRFHIVPTALTKDGDVPFLVVAMADPGDAAAKDAVQGKTGRRVRPTAATVSGIRAALDALASSSSSPALRRDLPPGAVTEVMSVADLAALEARARADAALAPPASTWAGALAPPHGAVPPAAATPRSAIAPEARNVRSTGSPGVDGSSAAAGNSDGSAREGGKRSAGAGRGAARMEKDSTMVAATPFCPDCGAERLLTAKFCPHCGCSFTGASRAKGAPPAVPPPTRPMMPAVSPVGAALSAALLQLKPGAPVDVEVLEGLKPPAGATVVQLRPRTAGAANVDEPGQLAGKEAHVGLGVTLLSPGIVTDASRPDELDAIAGRPPLRSAVAPVHLHAVTNAMARVDDVGALAPTLAPSATTTPTQNSAPKAAPSWSAPATLVIQSPVAGMAAALGAANGAAAWNTELAEGIARTSMPPLTAQAALVDDALALGNAPPFRIALATTHMPQFLADAALVDDVNVLGGEKAPRAPVLRAVLHRVTNALANVDDVALLAPKLSLAEIWKDAAERPIPRKDARNDAPVPRSREIFLNPAEAAPPPPPPEPKVEYVPAAPPTPAMGAPAPWAVVAAASAPTPEAPKQGPGLATMIMSLDDFEKQKLAERLRQKASEADGKDKK